MMYFSFDYKLNRNSLNFKTLLLIKLTDNMPFSHCQPIKRQFKIIKYL